MFEDLKSVSSSNAMACNDNSEGNLVETAPHPQNPQWYALHQWVHTMITPGWCLINPLQLPWSIQTHKQLLETLRSPTISRPMTEPVLDLNLCTLWSCKKQSR